MLLGHCLTDIVFFGPFFFFSFFVPFGRKTSRHGTIRNLEEDGFRPSSTALFLWYCSSTLRVLSQILTRFPEGGRHTQPRTPPFPPLPLPICDLDVRTVYWYSRGYSFQKILATYDPQPLLTMRLFFFGDIWCVLVRQEKPVRLRHSQLG